jgi:hypothetical protein
MKHLFGASLDPIMYKAYLGTTSPMPRGDNTEKERSKISVDTLNL